MDVKKKSTLEAHGNLSEVQTKLNAPRGNASISYNDSQLADKSHSNLHFSEIENLLQEAPLTADPKELSQMLFDKYHKKNPYSPPATIPSMSDGESGPPTPATSNSLIPQASSCSVNELLVNPRQYDSRHERQLAGRAFYTPDGGYTNMASVTSNCGPGGEGSNYPPVASQGSMPSTSSQNSSAILSYSLSTGPVTSSTAENSNSTLRNTSSVSNNNSRIVIDQKDSFKGLTLSGEVAGNTEKSYTRKEELMRNEYPVMYKPESLPSQQNADTRSSSAVASKNRSIDVVHNNLWEDREHTTAVHSQEFPVGSGLWKSPRPSSVSVRSHRDSLAIAQDYAAPDGTYTITGQSKTTISSSQLDSKTFSGSPGSSLNYDSTLTMNNNTVEYDPKRNSASQQHASKSNQSQESEVSVNLSMKKSLTDAGVARTQVEHVPRVADSGGFVAKPSARLSSRSATPESSTYGAELTEQEAVDYRRNAYQADQLLADRHLADRHLADRQQADQLLADRHLADRHLADRQQADQLLADRQQADRQQADRQQADWQQADRHRADRVKADRVQADRQQSKQKSRQGSDMYSQPSSTHYDISSVWNENQFQAEPRGKHSRTVSENHVPRFDPSTRYRAETGDTVGEPAVVHHTELHSNSLPVGDHLLPTYQEVNKKTAPRIQKQVPSLHPEYLRPAECLRPAEYLQPSPPGQVSNEPHDNKHLTAVGSSQEKRKRTSAPPPVHRRQNTDWATKSAPAQNLASDVYEFSLGGDAALRLPRELCMPDVCCTGLSTHSSLKLQNTSSRWLQVQLILHDVSLDGHELDLNKATPFVLKEKVIIEPHLEEEVKVIFAPRMPGTYVGQVEVITSHVVSDKPFTSKKIPMTLLLYGEAEKPDVWVNLKPGNHNQELDFGCLPWGSQKSVTFNLFNKSRCMVPVRLVITRTQKGANCFSFDQGNLGEMSAISSVGRPSLPGSSLSVICHTLEGTAKRGVPVKPVPVTVHFFAPPLTLAGSSSSESVERDSNWRERASKERPVMLASRLDVEMDMPTSNVPLGTLTLLGTVGLARILAPSDMDLITFKCAAGQSKTFALPLFNAGNIPVDLSLDMSHHKDVFNVVPMQAIVEVGKETNVTLKFSPNKYQKQPLESLLLMYVEPDGPSYEIQLEGEVQPPARDPSIASQPVPHSLVPVYANRQFLNWGGVAMGRGKLEDLALRNVSESRMKFRLEIKASHQDFQLRTQFGDHERVSRSREVIINPMEDLPVEILFAPTQPKGRKGKLTVRVMDGSDAPKYTVALSGYGGVSKLQLTDVEEKNGKYRKSVGPVRAGLWVTTQVAVCNIGDRAAYVKAVAYTGKDRRKLPADGSITLQPEEFCINTGDTQVVKLMQLISERQGSLCQTEAQIIALLSLFYGDEVSRKQLRWHVQDKGISSLHVPGHHPAKGVKFHIPFHNEDLINEELNLNNTTKDVDLFFKNMTEITVAVIGEPECPMVRQHLAVPKTRPDTKHVPSSSTDSISVLKIGPNDLQHRDKARYGGRGASQDRDKVKYVNLETSQDGDKARWTSVRKTGGNLTDQYVQDRNDDWEILPETITLCASTPGQDPELSKLQLLNHTHEPLPFQVSWPGHCVCVTPEQGVISPTASQTFNISANTMLLKKGIDLPWTGMLHISIAEEFKPVKVTILPPSDYMGGSCLRGVPLAPLETEEASDHVQMQKYTNTANEQPIHISGGQVSAKPSKSGTTITQMLHFNVSVVGKTQKSEVILTNHEDSKMQWSFSSLSPPYLKEHSASEGKIERLDHAIFYLSKPSGILARKSKASLTVTFQANKPGLYSQLWEVKTICVDEHGLTESSRIEFLAECAEVSSKKPHRPSLVNQGSSSFLRFNTDASAPVSVQSGVLSTTSGDSCGIRVKTERLVFPTTSTGSKTVMKLQVDNLKNQVQTIRIMKPKPPFSIPQRTITLKRRHFVRFPIEFAPQEDGHFEELLILRPDEGSFTTVNLQGESK